MSDEARLIIGLEARVAQFERNFAKASGTADKQFTSIERRSENSRKRLEASMATTAQRVNASLARIGSTGFDFAKGFATGAVTAGIAGVTAAAKAAFTSLAEMSAEAQRAGVGVEAFQRLSYAARQSGVSVDGLTDGLKEMALRADEFIVTGKGSGAEAFQRLGYGADELKTKLKDPETLFREIIGRLGQLNDAARIRVADEIFGGTGGEQFVRLVALGSKGIKDLGDQAKASGAVVDRELVDKAVELDRQYNAIADVISGRLKTAVVEVGTELIKWGQNLGSFIGDFEKLLNGLGNSSIFEKFNKWWDPDGAKGAAAGITVGPDMTGRNVGAQVGGQFGALQRSLETLGKSAAAAAGQVDGIKLPENGLPVGAKPYDLAKSYTGLTESANGPEIRALLGKTGQAFGGELRVWCADFVNAILASKGIKGTGSRSARSFLNFGEATTSPTEGDIVVLKRGKEGSGSGHVGFFQGYDERGRVKVLGGNQSEGINSQAYDSSRILGFRKQPAAGDDVTARLTADATATKEAEKAAETKAKSIDSVIEALTREAEAVGKTNEQEKLRQALQTAGVEIDSAEGQRIAAKIAQLYELKTAQEATVRSEEELKAARETLATTGADATKGFIADLKAGKSAAEAFANVLDKLVTKMTDQLIDGLFANMFNTGGSAGAAGGGGGILGSIGKLFGFAEGGYTGAGGKNQPAGVVHRGEVVWSQDDVARHGGPAVVDAMRRRLPGYADGGVVDLPQLPTADSLARPNIPRAQAARRAPSRVAISTSIDLTGANGDETIKRLARIEAERGVAQGLKAYDRQFGARLDYESKMSR